MKARALWLVAGTLTAVVPAFGQSAPPAGNAESGATVFKKCLACHQVGPEARNSIGPVLNGVVGRRAGTFPGYSYSLANKNSGLTWDEATLTLYLHAPRTLVPGTKMSFPGLPNDQDIADVIAYLKQFDADGQLTPPP
jgi:cytochrome c